MVKNLILINSAKNILKYDNRKAIELAQKLGRPLTAGEYKSLKAGKIKPAKPRKLIFKNKEYALG
jgi:hypothetical protein